ncbi:magnesium transporter CorA family protein [Stutzerimonas azotifigens]|uniref:magnesium transporter CorA family protein n=1 Tax=Stutzerimonas azotifigens TaxID=291995 RepID=UPI0004178690|nr:magnesium transporter CorA family protein [Stutzerimonas azotifigens]
MITYYALEHGLLRQRQAERLDVLPADLLWADLLSPSAEEEAFIERQMGLNIPTREELAEIEDTSRFYDEDGVLFMTTTVVAGVDERQPRTAQVTFVLTNGCLITVRYAELSPFRQFQLKLARQPGVYTSGALILMALLDAIVDRVADVLEAVQLQLNGLSQRIFEEERERRGELQHILRELGQHRSLLTQLGESLFSGTRLMAYYRLHVGDPKRGPARSWLKALERDLRSLGEHQAKLLGDIAFLLDATLGMISIEQNGIIKVFSIAAVLFLPPTLVGTVYGMNFQHMPELHWSFGYPLALGMMVVSAILPYAWFKFRGWL